MLQAQQVPVGEWEAGVAERFSSYLKEKVCVQCFGSSGACLSHVLWFLWPFLLPRPHGYLCYSEKGRKEEQRSLACLPSPKVFPGGALQRPAIGIPV